jgi:hypothetical protein
MLATLTIMIGAYIITRMLDKVIGKDIHVIVRIFAVMTALIAVAGIVDVVRTAASTSDNLQNIQNTIGQP